jgi:hypothetical protein
MILLNFNFSIFKLLSPLTFKVMFDNSSSSNSFKNYLIFYVVNHFYQEKLIPWQSHQSV